ncbi:MAG: bacillithiol system redox-active protein YtxJ [Flavobacterium sp.]|nr:bacillithiol system redox-active protein YtxJ [Flavobacterium sp.]
MSLFSGLFGSNTTSESSKVPWIPLFSMEQLAELTKQSFVKPVFIFKHSTRCGISRTVLKQFENEYDSNTHVDAYYLDLLEYRPISNAISTQFSIEHQSPQLIVLKNGLVVHYSSHSDIDALVLKKLV